VLTKSHKSNTQDIRHKFIRLINSISFTLYFSFKKTY